MRYLRHVPSWTSCLFLVAVIVRSSFVVLLEVIATRLIQERYVREEIVLKTLAIQENINGVTMTVFFMHRWFFHPCDFEKEECKQGIIYFTFSWPYISILPCDKHHIDALFILSLFRQSTSTCFGHICSPSSGGIVYTSGDQKVSVHLVSVL